MTSSLLSQIASSPSAANQFASGFNQLAQDLQSGNLSTAQQDYVTLSQEALNGSASSASNPSAGGITAGLLSNIASSSSSSSSFSSAFNQLGADLASGDLTSADSDMLSLDSTALNALPSASSAAGSSTSSKADSAALIQAAIQAMDVGDDSAIGSDISELSSVSASSTGAGYLKSDSASYGSGSSAGSGASAGSVSGGASSISQLLQSVNPDNSSSSGSTLSLLA
jgi:hypothetical protein